MKWSIEWDSEKNMWCYIRRECPHSFVWCRETGIRQYTPPGTNFPFPTMVPDGWTIEWDPLIQIWIMINPARPGWHSPRPVSPTGWRVEWDQAKNAWVYINLVTGKRQYRLPPPILERPTKPFAPVGWTVKWDQVQFKYYWINIETGDIQWTQPKGIKCEIHKIH